ncbi:hypothetical protein LIER_43447 [Lithospermum erythrorhizon]|uniref:Uncharacterized protein n=1 Tax=Lithospermum erythrorhizon TaxID=34254 RepID=A0AAV3Q643_LITER
MPGIDPAIVVPKSYVDSTFSPINQRKRLFNDEKNLAIREEVQTLLKAHAIRELKFPGWIANVVLGITKSVCFSRIRRKPLSLLNMGYIDGR